MNATEALQQLRDEGIRFKIDGLKLLIIGDLTPEQAELLKRYRREIAGIVHAEYCLMLEAKEALEGGDAYAGVLKRSSR